MCYIANILTLSNLVCGFLSILFSFSGNIQYAAAIIILGAAFDSIDGRAARKLGTNNDLGKELDSLADIITFGIAPMCIMFRLNYVSFFTILAMITYVCCSAVRLAKFNVQQSNLPYFIGMPVPCAALFTLVVVFIFPVSIQHLLVMILGILMISHIHLPNFKHQEKTEIIELIEEKEEG